MKNNTYDNIDERGFVKLKQINHETTMHFIKMKDSSLVSLTLSDSTKVNNIKTNNKAEVVFDRNSDNYIPVTVEVIDEKSISKEIFDIMLDNNFTHFKQWDDNIVTLKYTV